MSTTILIIDDTESNCEALSLNFEASGYAGDQKIVVNSLAEGLKAIRANPDLRIILLDLNLPGVSGEAALSQVYEELRKVGNNHALPIPMSAFPKEEVEARMSGNKVVVSSPDIMHSITGPKELSKVLETAEAQIARSEMKQSIEGLEKTTEELKKVVSAQKELLDDPFLLWKLITRNPLIWAGVMIVLANNVESAYQIWTSFRSSQPNGVGAPAQSPTPQPVRIPPRKVLPTPDPAPDPSPSTAN